MLSHVLAPFLPLSPTQLRTAIPPIDSVPPEIARPFFSVMIPTYNRSTYLRQTLESVLNQDLGPPVMEIHVVDNCSTEGDIGRLVQEVGRGRVHFFRHERNVGMVPNWNACVQRARGHWIHILHDDDLVLPEFYETYHRFIDRFPSATILFSPSILINEKNEELGQSASLSPQDSPMVDFLRRIAVSNHLRAPSVIVRRSVYESTGGFVESLEHTADWEMWFRAALHGTAVSIARPYTKYRVHPGSDTNRIIMSGSNITEYLLTVAHCLKNVPPDLRRRISASPYDEAARVALHTSMDLGSKHCWKGAFLQSLWAFRLRPSRSTLLWTGKSLLHYVWQTVKPFLQLRSVRLS